MNSTIEVEYRCVFQDYEEALVTPGTTSINREMMRAILGAVLLISGALVLTLLGLPQGASMLAMLLLLMIFGLVTRFVVRPIWIRRDFHKHPNFGRPCHLVIDDDGLHLTDEVSQSHKKWLAYTKYRETPNLIVLQLGARLVDVIPKRAFEAPQLDQFKELLQEKLPTRQRYHSRIRS